MLDTLALLLTQSLGRLPLPWAQGFSRCLGRLALLFNIDMVKVTRRNLAYCMAHLSAAERERLVRASMQHTAQLAVEGPVIWCSDDAKVDRLIKNVTGLEHVQAAQAAGKGLLVLAPHLGNWEVLGRYLMKIGPVTSMFQPPKLRRFGEFVKAGRARSGASLAATDRRGIAQVVSHLRGGGVTGVLPDQPPKEANSGLLAPFFGRPAFTQTFVCKLAQSTGCGVVVGFAQRVAGGFDIVFLPVPQALFSSQLEVAVSALNEAVEQAVNLAPEQYQWEYKRFKNNGDKTLYDDLV